MMNLKFASITTLLSASLLSFSSHAAIINFTFEGTTVETCTTCLGAGLDATAVYSIDTDNAFDGDGELYFQSATFTINGNTYDITQPPGAIWQTGGEVDQFNAEIVDAFSAYTQFYGYLDFDYDGGDLTSDNFVWNPYDGSDNAYSGDFTLTGNFYGNAHITVDGDLEAHYEAHTFSVTTSPVPVPAAVWLFASGLVGLIGVSRRQKTSEE